MAKACCEWCKKRRKTERFRVAMRRKRTGLAFYGYAVRYWEMCAECMDSCEWILNFRFTNDATE